MLYSNESLCFIASEAIPPLMNQKKRMNVPVTPTVQASVENAYEKYVEACNLENQLFQMLLATPDPTMREVLRFAHDKSWAYRDRTRADWFDSMKPRPE